MGKGLWIMKSLAIFTIATLSIVALFFTWFIKSGTYKSYLAAPHNQCHSSYCPASFTAPTPNPDDDFNGGYHFFSTYDFDGHKYSRDEVAKHMIHYLAAHPKEIVVGMTAITSNVGNGGGFEGLLVITKK